MIGWPSLRVLCVSVVTFAAAAYGARSYYSHHSQQQRRMAAWQSDQDLERRLDRIVEMTFRRTPSLQEWLAEWSRQAKIRAAVPETDPFGPSERTTIALSLPAMTARESLQTLARAYRFEWTWLHGEIVISSRPLQADADLRTLRLPQGLLHVPELDNVLRNALRHRAKEALILGSEVHLVAPSSVQLEAEVFIRRLAAAIEQAEQLSGDKFALDAANWKPILLDEDAAAMDRALAALRQPVPIELALLPLEKLAAEAASTLKLPVILDEDLLGPELQVQTDESLERASARSFADVLAQRRLRALPVASGRAIKLIGNRDSEPWERITYAYPVTDLIQRRRGRDGERLAQLLVNLVPGAWYDLSTRERVGMDVCGPLLIVNAETHVHDSIVRLLDTMRRARSGLEGSSVRGEPFPEAADEIAARLEQWAELDYVDVPLQDVIADIGRRFDLPIELDAFYDVGASDDARIWCHLPTAPLAENLQRLLSPYRLTYGVQRDVVLVISQTDARLLRSEPSFQYEVLNLRALWQSGTNVPEEVDSLVVGFDDAFEWQSTGGGRGRTGVFGDLLLLHNHATSLNRVRRVFQAVERQSLLSPSEVHAGALQTESSPLCIHPQVTNQAALRAHERTLWRRLATPVTVSLEQATSTSVLLKLARDHDLPIVCPGSHLVDIAAGPPLSIHAQDEPLVRVLERLLTHDSGKHWVIASDGTLQTWDPNFLPERVQPEHWLFDVSDLVQPAGPRTGDELQELLVNQFSRQERVNGIIHIDFHLARFLHVHALPSDCQHIQNTLHALRVGRLPDLAPQTEDVERTLQP